jgi:hypothetical protein
VCNNQDRYLVPKPGRPKTDQLMRAGIRVKIASSRLDLQFSRMIGQSALHGAEAFPAAFGRRNELRYNWFLLRGANTS